jgi:hypothetical protein
VNQQHLDNYFIKSGDDHLSQGNIEYADHGFCVWRDDKDILLLVNVYGNGQYWNKWAEKKAKELNVSRIVFATKRNPDAFIRKHGFELSGYILERSV